jgi:hypothetical protein
MFPTLPSAFCLLFSVILMSWIFPQETVHAFENPLAACAGVMDGQRSDLLRRPEVLN